MSTKGMQQSNASVSAGELSAEENPFSRAQKEPPSRGAQPAHLAGTTRASSVEGTRMPLVPLASPRFSAAVANGRDV